MGFELEAEASIRVRHPSRAVDDGEVDLRVTALARRWQDAEERLALAQASWQALRGRVPVDDPRSVASQLLLAQARYRRYELDLELRRLQAEFDTPTD